MHESIEKQNEGNHMPESWSKETSIALDMEEDEETVKER